MRDPICKPMPAEVYHADKTAWSKGMLMDFRSRRSVCRDRHILRTAPEKQSTRSMDIGDVAHVALLEPHKLSTHYVTIPQEILASNGAISTKEAKAFKAEHEAAGRVVLKTSEYAIIQAMVKNVQSKLGKWLTAPAKVEHSLYWTDETTELRCKCRPDFLVVNNNACVILDIKTTADVSPGEFSRRCESMGYWLQDAHYSAGVRSVFKIDPLFLFVAVETEWPYQCAVYELSPSDKSEAHEARNKLLCDVATCYETGNWEDEWTQQVTTLNLRKYIYAA